MFHRHRRLGACVALATLAAAAAACSARGPAEEARSSVAQVTTAQCAQAKPWAAGVSYSAGDLVTFGGEVYVCQQSHTSQDGWTPSAVPALWELTDCSSGGGSTSSGGTTGGSTSSSGSGSSGSSSGGSSGSTSGSGSGSGGGAFTQTFSTWYCGDSCGSNDLSSCGTTYCGSQVTPTVLGAALSIDRMNGPSGTWMGGGLCGKQIEIVALDTGRSIVVPVIDACEACNADDHVDLTLGVWQQLGLDTCAGTFRQEWRFVN